MPGESSARGYRGTEWRERQEKMAPESTTAQNRGGYTRSGWSGQGLDSLLGVSWEAGWVSLGPCGGVWGALCGDLECVLRVLRLLWWGF